MARDERRAARAPLAVAAGLALAPVLVQWPVTQAVLGSAESLTNPVNLRFYYLSACGIVLALATLWSPLLQRRMGRIALVFAAPVMLGAWLPASYQEARAWAEHTNGEEHALTQALMRALDGGEFREGCRVHLRVTESTYSTFGGFVDAAVKAQLPPRHPLLACVVLLESRVPYYSITASVPCADEPWTPLAPRVIEGRAFTARRIGNLCYHYFEAPAPAWPGTPGVDLWFAYDGRGFRPVAAVE
jgi:hypothetical protein